MRQALLHSFSYRNSFNKGADYFYIKYNKRAFGNDTYSQCHIKADCTGFRFILSKINNNG